MEPRIEQLVEKKMIGKKMTMSFAENKTGELWRSFMPHRKSVTHTLSSDLYSLQIFEPNFFETFDPHKPFTKWALVEVSDFEVVPNDMETFVLPAGKYAVFIHRGAPSEFAKTFGYIFNQWLPNSQFLLDDRPHFEILGSKYKHNSPDSEEEVWIPVREKGGGQGRGRGRGLGNLQFAVCSLQEISFLTNERTLSPFSSCKVLRYCSIRNLINFRTILSYLNT